VKKVGIAISSYITNAQVFNIFKRCIHSLYVSNSEIDTIYIIDDCSSYKEVFETYDFYSGLCSKIKVIKNKENKGIAKVKNISLELLSDFDTLILSDNDNFFRQGWDTFYINAYNQSQIRSINNSNIFGTDTPIETFSKNGIQIGKFSKFQGNFIMIDKDILNNVGGFPVLPKKYGIEHVNYQYRVNKYLDRENVSYDIIGGNTQVKNLYMSNTFISKEEKIKCSEINAKISDRLLSTNEIKYKLEY
jgi:hypothetical protein